MKIETTPGAPLCGCGQRGCLEAFVGTIGIRRRVEQSVAQKKDSVLAQRVGQCHDFKIDQVARAAQADCKEALKIWEDTGYYLGVGIANLVLILDLDTVVLTGGVSGAAGYFMPALQKVLDEQPFRTPFEKLKITVSKNPDIGGVGAALYALHQAKQDTPA